MTRTKCAVALAAVLALGLLSVKLAISADGPGLKAPAAGEAWDDGGPMPGGHDGQLAQRGPDGFGPPGPPRDGDDDRPPPPPGQGPGQGRGPQADRGQPQGPPPDGGQGGPMGPPPERRGPGFGDRQPQGPPPEGGQGRQPMPPRGGPGQQPDGRQPMGPPGGPRDDWQSMQKKDPEMFALVKQDMELERQTRELAMQYRQASKDERDKLKPQIEEVVGKHFDVRQQRRTLELKRMEQQLQQLRETIDRRGKARKEIVEKRVSELTGQGDEMGF